MQSVCAHTSTTGVPLTQDKGTQSPGSTKNAHPQSYTYVEEQPSETTPHIYAHTHEDLVQLTSKEKERKLQQQHPLANAGSPFSTTSNL
jgi:hypothetical protein